MNITSQSALLAISRDKRGSRDIFRSYAVIVDGEKVGRIRRGKRLEIPIAPGDHEIFLKIDWCQSSVITFTVREGNVVEFACRPGGSMGSGSRDAAIGESYISLTRVHPG